MALGVVAGALLVLSASFFVLHLAIRNELYRYLDEDMRGQMTAIAEYAARVNEATDDIGARRLHTVMEKLLEDLSFDAPELGPSRCVVDEPFVRMRLERLVGDQDLSRYIL